MISRDLKVRSLQIRCEKAKDEYSEAEAQAENMRLKMLLQQADQAAMQLEIEVSNAWDEEMQDGDDDAAAQRCLAALRDSYAGMGAVRDSTAEVDS